MDLQSLINLGNKFVPSYFLNKICFLVYLLKYIDLNILKFDNFLNISKSKYLKSLNNSSTLSNSDSDSSKIKLLKFKRS